MRWPCVLGMLSTLAVAHASAPTTTTAPAHKPAAKPGTAKKATTPAAGSAAKAKRTKATRNVRKAAGPNYQLHPDPQRYSEIQKALADRGYFHGEANGEWKDDSIDALKRFQADQKLPDDGKISALTLTGLGLGPHHDGSTAATVPVLSAPVSEPAVSGSTVGPAASTAVKRDEPPASAIAH